MTRFLEILFDFKPGELAGADDWRPSFVGAPQSSWAVLAIILLAAGLVWLTLRSYLREGEAPRRAKLTLAGLRIASILLVLAILLQPAITLRRFQADTSTVVVLLDDSQSMSLADRYAPTAQRAMLAAALGVAEADLAGLSRAQIVRELLGRSGGALGRLAKDHPLMLLRFSTPSPDQEAYTQPVLLLDQTERKAPVTAAVESSADTQGRLRLSASRPAADTRPAGVADEDQIASQVRESLSGLAGRGFRTDLAQAVRDAAEKVRGRRVAAMVLITDGQPTGGAADAARLAGARQFLRQRNIPLLTVCVGDDRPPRNVRVAALNMPSVARVGASSPAQVDLESRNYVGESATVRLLRQTVGQAEWTDTGVYGTVTFQAEESPAPGEGAAGEGAAAAPDGAGPSAARATLNLNVQCDQPGRFVYKAVVDPKPDELLTDDNQAVARVTVAEEKVRVLLLAGDAGWEFQYLRNLLLRSPNKYLVSVWQQDADAAFNQESSTGMKLTALPKTLAELADRFDVVLLYDPLYTTDGFDEKFAALLNEFVSTHRGGLAYIASNKNTGDNLAGDTGFTGPFEPLIKMLPVTVAREALNIAERIGHEAGAGWPVRLTGAGADHPVMQLDRDPHRNRAIWDSLPGVFWSQPVGRIKPAAVALAASSDPTRRTADNEPLPLVVMNMYGRGPVLYVGLDTTWRWRYVEDGKYFNAFWTNALDFLASYRLMKKRVILTSAGDAFSVGDAVRITAEVYDEAFQPLAAGSYRVRLIDAQTGEAQAVELSHVPAPEGSDRPSPVYRGSVHLARAGEFELTAAEGVDPDTVAGKVVTVTLPREEFLRPEANPTVLKTLSGEKDFYGIERIEAMARTIPPGRREIIQSTTRDLWSVWLTMVVLCTLLMTEWVARKKHNMA